MTAATCHSCRRELSEGESAWADDWNVIDVSGPGVRARVEVRFTCDDCEAAR